ncbi:MAG: permease [Candidatus Marinimicrobia bacterium]|nr:permease [Candidatus Neomarinimicrobiota bacterium]
MPILLSIAIGALILGPLVAQALRKNRPVNQVLDGFVLVSITGLAMLHLLPEAILSIQWGALVMLAIGALLPSLIEHRFHEMEHKAHVGVILVVLVGILVHTLLDGMALSEMSVEHGAGEALAIAVVLHRLPVGILVWWSARSAYGKRGGIFTLSVMAIFTLVGYWLGGNQFQIISSPVVSYLQALITGSLLHVILHKPYYQEVFEDSDSGKRSWQVWSGLGALLGIVLLVLMPADTHGHAHELIQKFLQTTWRLYMASAPALLAGFVAASLLGVFFPQAGFNWLKGRGRTSRVSRGMLFGLPLPICSCGVVPLYQTLVRKGTPVGAAVAFLIATPELGLDAILISYPLLGGTMLIVRLVAAAVIAFSVAWIMDKRFPPSPQPVNLNAMIVDENATPDERTLKMKTTQFWNIFNHELIDELGPWLIVGIILAAAAQPLLEIIPWVTIPGWFAVLVMTLVGLPIYVCASGATPLGAVMLASGVAPGAVLAFLITGPASNVTTLGVLRNLHGKRFMWSFLLTIIGITWLVGLVVNWVVPESALSGSAMLEKESFGWYQWISAFTLGLFFLMSLLRIGPRGMVETVLSAVDDEDDNEDDHHGHAH